MPITIPKLNYIIDDKGKKAAVVIDIKSFECLLDKVEDLYLSATAQEILKKDKSQIPHKEAMKMLSRKRDRISKN